jgi:hypothetical protein
MTTDTSIRPRAFSKRLEAELSCSFTLTVFDPEIDSIQLMESDTADPVML